MKDAYKDVMDAVKAPDALVEKTLKRMLEEQKKLEANRDTDKKERNDPATGLRDIGPIIHRKTEDPPRHMGKASPGKHRWITRIALPAAACLSLLFFIPRLLTRDADILSAPVDHSYNPGLETPVSGVHGTGESTESTPESSATGNLVVQNAPTTETHDAFGVHEPAESIIEALAVGNLATRSGPGVGYRETGTYQTKGETVRLVSLAYDEDGTCWVQCEVLYGDRLRWVYTGITRFDTDTFDLDRVPGEEPLHELAKVSATTQAMYGPGDGYGTYTELTVDEGQTVNIVATEGDYTQVEWTTSLQSYRAWVPADILDGL